MTAKEKPTGLALLREPFPANQISKLPKPTSKQTQDLKAAQDRKDFSLGVKCRLCGQWHHKDAIHLDYVGHAALTDRLLDADPEWNWEPVTDSGLPALDQNVGMWVKLTVCGVTRLGYGHAEGKKGGDAIKEVIGDALRNAAMRFGAALDLWHKGDLHALDDEPAIEPALPKQSPAPRQQPAPDHSEAIAYLTEADTLEELKRRWENMPANDKTIPALVRATNARKAELSPKPTAQSPITDDEIPHQ